MYKCKLCERNFDNYESLRKHNGRIHKIKSEDFYIEFYLNGIHATCKCGCGEKVKFTGHGFKEYKVGHIAKIKNNWGHNQKAIDKSSKTRRLQYANGERKVWNDGLTKETSHIVKLIGEMSKKENNPERILKISNTLKNKFLDGTLSNSGINNPMFGKKHSIDTIKKIFAHKKMNKLELLVANELYKNNIPYYFQFFITENTICKSYDFKIKGKPIIIEIDGDYWHGGPGAKLYWKNIETVKKNDLFKNKLAESKGYKVLRFWESEIKKEPEKVIKKLLNEISL